MHERTKEQKLPILENDYSPTCPKSSSFFTTNQKIYECATEKSLCLGPRQNIGDLGGLLEVPDLY